MLSSHVPVHQHCPVQRFCKEVVTWKTLRHPNVLPLMGVMISEAHFAIISDWMVNGNISDFVKAHPDANRLELVGFSLSLTIFASGSLVIGWLILAGRRR